jgi:hypothetical protein
MRREGVRHPMTSFRRWLPPSMCSHVCLFKQNVGLLLNTNVPTLLGVHQLVMYAFCRDRFCYLLFPFDYLYLLRFLVK